jgi:hypothetical protein
MSSEWNERFAVVLECKACRAQFEVEHPDPSRFGKKVVDIGTRRPAG